VAKKTVEGVELSEFDKAHVGKAVVASQSLDVVRDVQVKLTAVLGETTLSVNELFNLTENSVVKLSSLADEPIALYLDNQVVARGMLVIADDNFGLQITEVVSEK
jgi:flagellar motor switch protein FliN